MSDRMSPSGGGSANTVGASPQPSLIALKQGDVVQHNHRARYSRLRYMVVDPIPSESGLVLCKRVTPSGGVRWLSALPEDLEVVGRRG